MKIARIDSPNCGPRRDGLRPRLVVLHYTAMKDAAGAIRHLCNPKAEVSAHYVIARDGDISQLVDENLRAWHAGAGAWGGCDDINSRSIGIELDNDGFSPFSASLMVSLESLLPPIMQRWDIAPAGVIGHSDMAPGRKIDPGARFDWQRLARQGLSVWPEIGGPSGANATGFLTAAGQFGYANDDLQSCLDTMRLRFRPQVSGPLDGVDMAIMQDLARRFPVDALGLNA